MSTLKFKPPIETGEILSNSNTLETAKKKKAIKKSNFLNRQRKIRREKT